jgi:ATP-dependent helicase HrpA
VVQDVDAQLRHLLAAGFLVDTPWPWLLQFPRYLEAAARRLERLGGGRLERDRQLTGEIAPLQQACMSRRAELARQGVHDAALETYRWMLEEYRVSLFAQDLGTAAAVSAQRLARQWAEVRG